MIIFIMKMTVKLEIYLTLVMCSLLNIAICGVCPVSTPTVASVPRCPATMKEMKEAAQRKKCEMLADSKHCDMPPVYHCLLNQWNNDTIEVCASPWYISGFCAIYNTVEMKVTDDFGRDCTIFPEGKCPTRYHSPEAYKYQNCYNKTSDPLQSQTTNSRQQSSNAISSTETTAFIVVIVVLCVIVCILVSGILIWRYGEKLQETGCRKWPCFSKTRDRFEEEYTNNRNTESKTLDSQSTPLISNDQSHTISTGRTASAVTERTEGVTMDKDNSKSSPSSLSPNHGNNPSPVIDASPRRPVMEMVKEAEKKKKNSATDSKIKSSPKNSRIVNRLSVERDPTENLADSTRTEPENKINSDELSSKGEDNGDARSENTSKCDFQEEGTQNNTSICEATKHDSDINQLNSNQSDGSMKEATSVPPTQTSNEVIKQSENDKIDAHLADTAEEKKKIADKEEQSGSDQPTVNVKSKTERYEKENIRKEK